MEVDGGRVCRGVQRVLGAYKEERRGPTYIVVQANVGECVTAGGLLDSRIVRWWIAKWWDWICECWTFEGVGYGWVEWVACWLKTEVARWVWSFIQSSANDPQESRT